MLIVYLAVNLALSAFARWLARRPSSASAIDPVAAGAVDLVATGKDVLDDDPKQP